MADRRFQPEHYQRLLDPERRNFNDPEIILDELRLQEGHNLADVGAGPGWFTLPAARRVGVRGRVYALDVSAEMLSILRSRLVPTLANRVVCVKVTSDSAWPLAEKTMDAVLVANVLHELSNPFACVHEVRRILRPGGLVLVVEWHPQATEMGPPADHRLESEVVEQWFHKMCFTLDGRPPIGPYHYGLRFVR